MVGTHGYFLTTNEAAKVAGVEPGTIRQWVRRGHLKAMRLGGRRLWFTAKAVENAEYEVRMRDVSGRSQTRMTWEN